MAWLYSVSRGRDIRVCLLQVVLRWKACFVGNPVCVSNADRVNIRHYSSISIFHGCSKAVMNFLYGSIEIIAQTYKLENMLPNYG